jgi:hypothetical protein
VGRIDQHSTKFARWTRSAIHRYLEKERSALHAKLDRVGEREVRWPMTQTGTNLLGLLKHVASIELGYFGEVFDRPSHVALPWFDEDAETNADMWATAEESREDIVTRYERAAVHADATIGALTLDSPGRVPWWPAERQQVTLHQIMVHVTAEIARHAGHADIIRELIDGAAGDNDGNLPDQTAQEWRPTACDSRRRPLKLRSVRKMHDPRQPRTHHLRACISKKCGLYMSPRMLPKGSTTEAVTNPASRSVTG